MIDSVLKTIDKYGMLSQNDRIVVAVSGGPDSMALLHILYCIRMKYSLYIHVAHLNHMMRGEESEVDTQYVRDYCISCNIPYTIRYGDINSISKEEGVSIEEAGRKVRYELFSDIAREITASKIALAHNLNDQAETMLMRIMRGTGLDGLCGIKPVRDNLYIRPFINTPRYEIEEYCTLNNLNPRIDSTNLEPIYMRNKIRLELIPYIKENYNQGIENSLAGMSRLLREDNDFIDDYANTVYKDLVKDNNNKLSIDIISLKNLNNAIKKRVIRKAIEGVNGSLVGIESKHIELILAILERGSTGSAVDLPGSIKAIISYNNLNIIKTSWEPSSIFAHILRIPGTTSIHEIKSCMEASLINGSFCGNYNDNIYIKYFDYDKIKDSVYIRNRRVGDYIIPFGMNGRKKIKDIFIDNKIPREERENIPLVAVGNEIIWVVGYYINNNYKIDNSTKKILKLEFM